MIKLTVLYKNRMEAAQIYKTEKYADLAKKLKKRGYQVKVLAAEVGAEVGFVAESEYIILIQLSVGERKNKLGPENNSRSSREILKLDMAKMEPK